MSAFHFNIKTSFQKGLSTCLTTSLFLTATIITLAVAYFFKSYQNKFYQGISIDGIYIGGLTQAEALTKLNSKAVKDYYFELELAVDDIKIASSSSQLGQKTEYQTILAETFEIERAGFPLIRLVGVIKLLITPQNFSSKITYQYKQVNEMINQLKTQVDLKGKEPSALLAHSGSTQSLSIDPGKPGRELIFNESKEIIYRTLKNLESDLKSDKQISNLVQVEAQVASTSSLLTEKEVSKALKRASFFVGKSAILENDKIKGVRILLTDQTMVELLNLPAGVSQKKLNILLDKWVSKVNRDPVDAIFSYDPKTLQVTEFQPHRDGLTLDNDKTSIQINELIAQIEEAAKKVEEENAKMGGNQQAKTETTETADRFDLMLNVKTTQPNKPLSETNDLGINELIGFGDSHYAHSIPNRIYNVAHAAERLNHIIIKPGAEFRFNQAMGEVSSRTGFKSAYIISNGRTELAAGGGVCQVSTTFFRAVLDAGLKVTKRKAHSYRVSYYELDNKPGFDATVYSGDTDLRFINDTNHHILVNTYTDSANVYMYIELYGTSDGRTTEITDYRMWDYQGPPAPVYIPDPSLPVGTLKQIDWSASGIKSEFTNVVKDKDGNVIREDYYYSNFRPWSAKYLQGV